MKNLSTFFACVSLSLLVLTGCQWPGAQKNPVVVVIEDGSKFPKNMVGKWKGEKLEWGMEFNKDGTIKAIRIPLGKSKIEPGKTNRFETKIGGTAGIVNGKVTFPDGIKEPGEYEARLFFANDYEVKAKADFTVGSVKTTSSDLQKNTRSEPSVRTESEHYSVDEPIVVNFKNASGDRLDWVGLYKKGADQKTYLDWYYTDGRRKGEAVYEPGVWTVAYAPATNELSIEIVIDYISVEVGYELFEGKVKYLIVGELSQDNTVFKGTVYTYPDYKRLPLNPEDIPLTEEILLVKVEGIDI